MKPSTVAASSEQATSSSERGGRRSASLANATGPAARRVALATLAGVGLGSWATAALAQEAAGKQGSVIFDYLDDGGSVMYVILAVSILGTVLFLDRALDMYLLRRLPVQGFMSGVLAEVEARRYRKALDLCNLRSQHPLVSVMRAGILRANRREAEIERAMEREMLSALPQLQKRVGILGLLANTATLVGLLGTIFGLITAFNSVAAASAAERQTALAAGISQAMYTTAFGISVAVPLLFFHHFIARRQERILVEVECGASALLVALSGPPDGADVAGAEPDTAQTTQANAGGAVPAGA